MHHDKPTQLRRLLVNNSVVRIAGAHTAVSARLVERNGFDAIWASGLEISTSYAVPDAGVLGMAELLEAARLMSEATQIPVISDCDTGFGESRNVQHMVHRYEAAGIAGVCIEDKHFPKLNSFAEGDQLLVPTQAFADKIKVAKDSQVDPDFMVVARTETLIAGKGIDEALARAHAYADAGADAILIHSKERSPQQVFDFARQWQNRRPLIAVPTTYFETKVEDFREADIRAVIYANHAMRAAVKAMDETLAQIVASGSTETVERNIASLSRLFELQGLAASSPGVRETARGDHAPTQASHRKDMPVGHDSSK